MRIYTRALRAPNNVPHNSTEFLQYCILVYYQLHNILYSLQKIHNGTMLLQRTNILRV